MTLRTADDPSSDRMNPVIASPRAANTAAPSASDSTSESRWVGHGVDFSKRPSAKSDATWIAKTIMIETSTAVR